MEFNEKLQQLRKERGMTQEQLAEKLYVSRTAISKWESGRGYPNIESLKEISKVFSITIDDLLSSEECITLASNENHLTIHKFICLSFGVLDIMTLIFLVLPLYGRQDHDLIRIVSLFSHPDANGITWTIYVVFPIVMAILGMLQLLVQKSQNTIWYNKMKLWSLVLQACYILALISARQPYATSLLFLFFIMKMILLIKGNQLK